MTATPNHGPVTPDRLHRPASGRGRSDSSTPRPSTPRRGGFFVLRNNYTYPPGGVPPTASQTDRPSAARPAVRFCLLPFSHCLPGGARREGAHYGRKYARPEVGGGHARERNP